MACQSSLLSLFLSFLLQSFLDDLNYVCVAFEIPGLMCIQMRPQLVPDPERQLLRRAEYAAQLRVSVRRHTLFVGSR